MFTNCSPNFVLLEGCNIKCDLLCFVYLTIRFLLCSKSCNRLINIIQIFIFSLLNTKLQYCLIATHAWNFKGTAPVELGEILEVFDSLRLLHCRMDWNYSFQLVGPGSTQISWPSYSPVFLLALFNKDHQEQLITSQTQSVWISIE